MLIKSVNALKWCSSEALVTFIKDGWCHRGSITWHSRCHANGLPDLALSSSYHFFCTGNWHIIKM